MFCYLMKLATLLTAMFIVLFGYPVVGQQFHQRCPEPFKTEYCFNDGECFLFGSPDDGFMAVCQCVPGFMGERCNQKYSVDISRDHTTESPSANILVTEQIEPESSMRVSSIALLLMVLFMVLLMVIWGILAHVTSIVDRMGRNLSP